MAGQPTSETTSAKKHSVNMMELVGKKHRKYLSCSLNEQASAPVSNFAKTQLEKMGWSQGTGLGKNRDGMVEHIRVKKREDGAGLGTEQHALQVQSAQQDWWKNSLSATLSKLGGSKKGKKHPREYTDEELFEATGGVRFGTKGKGKTRNLNKWKRTESMESRIAEVSVEETTKETSEERAERKRLKKERKEAKRAKNEAKRRRKEAKKSKES